MRVNVSFVPIPLQPDTHTGYLGPRDPESDGQDGPCRCDGCSERDEECNVELASQLASQLANQLKPQLIPILPGDLRYVPKST